MTVRFFKTGELVDMAHSASVSKGDFVVAEGLKGFAADDSDSSAGYVLERGGHYTGVPKATGAAWTKGDVLEYDSSAEKFQALDGGKAVAIAAADATSGATTGDIILLEAPVAQQGPTYKDIACPLTANATTTFLGRVPFDCTVSAILLHATAKAASASGDVTFAITGGGNNLLEAATFDLESLTNATDETLTLQSTTPANLSLSKGDIIKISIVSDNADATGAADLLCSLELTPA